MYNIEELNEKAHKLRELKVAAEELDNQIKSIENEIKAHMEKNGLEKLVGDDWTIFWTQFSSSRFDQSLFKERHPDLFESFKVSTSSRRFSLK